MSAFIECRVCGKQVSGDARLTDERLTEEFNAKGWTIQPTRCPDHVAVADSDIPRRDACPMEHDPEPFEHSVGIMTGGRPVAFGGRRDYFRPRSGYCTLFLHSIESPKEFEDAQAAPAAVGVAS